MCFHACVLQALLGAALRTGGHAASDVSYVAVHGTGTPLGDPIEVGALAAALSSRHVPGLAVGSVKVGRCASAWVQAAHTVHNPSKRCSLSFGTFVGSARAGLLFLSRCKSWRSIILLT